MRQENINNIPSQSPTININGAAISSLQLVSCSAQISATGTAAGTFKLQASDDQVFLPTLPSHWNDITGATVSVSGANSYLIPKIDLCYEYIRAVYISTAIVVNNITTVADVSNSLNNKYFYVNSASVAYYVWFNVSAGGTNPLVPGKTGIEIDISTNDTANTVAAAIRAATIAGITLSGATNHAIFTNNVGGPAPSAVDGAAPTGFSFSATQPSGTISAQIKCLGF